MKNSLQRFKRLIATLFLAPMLSACVTAGETPNAFDARVATLVREDMAARGTPGVAVAVIADGRVVTRATFGQASVELGVPVSAATLFPMASTSKEFTATAIMSLVEDGRIRLGQPVRELLPELPQAWSAVTVAHCLSHTSGLPDATEPDAVNIIPVAGERSRVLEQAAQKQAGVPGAVSSYNQMGVLLLAMIVERVSGTSFEAFVEQRLWKPLEIEGMAFGDSWAVVPGRASLYTALKPNAERTRLAIANGQPVFESGKLYAFGSKGFPDWMHAAAGLNASLDAMIAWEIALHGGRLLKTETLASMSKPFHLNDGGAGAFGLGLIPGQYKGMATVSSGGGAAVWVTTIPERRLTVIVLTNMQGSAPQNLITRIFDAYFAPSVGAG